MSWTASNRRLNGKQPYAIARRDEAPLAFAGLWEGRRSPQGEALRTFDILTTSANGTIDGRIMARGR